MKFSRCASKDGVSFYCASLTGWQAALIFSFAVICYFTEGDHLMAESSCLGPKSVKRNVS